MISRHRLPTPIRTLWPAVSIVAILTLSGCPNDPPEGSAHGDGGTHSSLPVPAAGDETFTDLTGQSTVEISVIDNKFEPRFIRISAGTEVTWVNNGRNSHNVIPVDEDAFEGVGTEDFAPDDVHAVTFDSAGEFPYFCSIHGTAKAGQNGTIVVVD